jgi:tRNA modification GTPase
MGQRCSSAQAIGMVPDPNDTILALSSAPGTGGRAIIRVSGPDAYRVTGSVLSLPAMPGPHRRWFQHSLRLPGLHSGLPADVYVWAGPRSYTGQDLIELHTIACAPLIVVLMACLLQAGARAAQPGEFTLRAFLLGKLDLTRVEAVLGVIEAGTRKELKDALAQLAGGVGRPLQVLRDDLLDLLAEVEAGLDFAEQDLETVEQEALLMHLAKALAQVTLVQKQLDQRAVAGRPFRVVLAGRPNAGKSSLFNALAGGSALVSADPGTTRDYLVRSVRVEGVAIDLVDTAGWSDGRATIDRQAQALGRQQAAEADLIIVCLETGQVPNTQEAALLAQTGSPSVLGVATKCDLGPGPPAWPATSAVSGSGVEALRRLLVERARTVAHPAMAPSLSRCRHHVQGCLDHLRQAHAAVLYQDPAEILALELRGALDNLGEMVGAIYTDDLLDRIFSRFCIGK